MKLKLLILYLFAIYSLGNSQVLLLKDTAPGTDFGNPNNFIEINGNLIFTSNLTLFKTDGTSVNTNTILSNGNLSLRDFGEIFPSLVSPNEIIAVAQLPTQDRELYKINISNGNILNFDINPNSASSNPTRVTVVNISGIPYLIFRADGGATGVELYTFNRNSETVTLAQDYVNGNGDFTPDSFFEYASDNSVLFSGITPADGRELYKYDGNNIIYIKNIGFNQLDSNPNNFVELNGEFYFRANDNTAIWKTDGKSSGTVSVRDFSGLTSGSVRRILDYSVGNELYFVAFAINGSNPGLTLWKTDGTTVGTTFVKTLSTNGYQIQNQFDFNGYHYYTLDSGSDSVDLWRTDGTANGTTLVDTDPTTTDPNYPSGFTEIGGRVYFAANRAVTGRELFAITPTGSITLAANINPGNADSNPRDFLEYNGKIYFRADDGTHGIELWSYDLTNFTASLVDDIEVGSGSSSPVPRYVFNDVMYIDAFRSDVGREPFMYQDPTLSTNSPKEVNSFKLYPNPATEAFEIASQIPVETVTITDISGKVVKQFNEALNQYNVTDITSGIYFIKIVSGTSEEILKLVKN